MTSSIAADAAAASRWSSGSTPTSTSMSPSRSTRSASASSTARSRPTRPATAELVDWAEGHGPIEAFGIEGTGSYGAGLTSAVRRRGHRVVEVNRGIARLRRANGKSDTSTPKPPPGPCWPAPPTAIPKTADGHAEMIRQVKDRPGHRRQGPHLGDHHPQADHRERPRRACASRSPRWPTRRSSTAAPASAPAGSLDSTTASAKHTLRALARRWLFLNDEIRDHDRHLAPPPPPPPPRYNPPPHHPDHPLHQTLPRPRDLREHVMTDHHDRTAADATESPAPSIPPALATAV